MDTQAVITHIARWLDEVCRSANVKGFVVGVSGGIDSAVVSALAARTGRTTLLLDMPIRQHPDQLERARLHIRNLQRQYANVSAQTVDLTDTFQPLNKPSALIRRHLTISRFPSPTPEAACVC